MWRSLFWSLNTHRNTPFGLGRSRFIDRYEKSHSALRSHRAGLAELSTTPPLPGAAGTQLAADPGHLPQLPLAGSQWMSALLMLHRPPSEIFMWYLLGKHQSSLGREVGLEGRIHSMEDDKHVESVEKNYEYIW